MGSARMTAADTAGGEDDLGPQFGFVIPVKAARRASTLATIGRAVPIPMVAMLSAGQTQTPRR
jgi:hypothetical protein